MKRRIALSVIFYLIITFSVVNVLGEETVEPYFNLVLRANGETIAYYGLYLAEDLQDINIEVEVKVEPFGFGNWFNPLTDDFDMTFSYYSNIKTHDMRDYYTEDGKFNLFRLNKSIPYQGESEIMQNEAVALFDLDDRHQLYYDWEILMMDKILPLLPLFRSRRYMATWANTVGYDLRWGIVDSLPYIYFDGFHEGQESLTEFRMADANWRDLNPLQTADTSSSFIFSLMAESIVGWSPDLAPLKTSLVIDWEQIDEFHYKFTMRDGVYWNPSYNITSRDASSDPLDPATTPLMEGLKAGEVSNGENQQVTAKDAVFTYLAWANSIVSESPSYHNWISNAYVDPEDELTYHLHIDGNPTTLELEIYSDFWEGLAREILPEFFLNSSDSTVSYSSGGAECTGLYDGILDTDPWVAYSTSAFGCGKYMLDYYIRSSVTVLQASPYWMGIGVIDGTEQDLDIETFNVRVIPDISAELAEFKAGILDLVGLFYFPSERKQMQADPRFNFQSILVNGFNFLAFNMVSANIGGSNNLIWLNGTEFMNYTKALAIRKAICYAIDRNEINSLQHDGEYLIFNRPMLNFGVTFYYDVFPIIYDYDLDLAWKWMEAAGYERPEKSISLFLPSCLSILILIIFRKRQKN
jgi:ABC-type transport system substrate-binding protein